MKDISVTDLRKILKDAKKRKSLRKNLNNLDIDKGAPLKGKLLIQMFEKSSLRTRLSFYLAIKQLGGSTLTLRPDELHLSKGAESIEDTAKILSNFGNAFMLRTDNDIKLEEFKKYLSIPIINGLSPSSHPTQILSDIFTIEEIKKKSISKLNIAWIGDSNNVLNSLIAASIKFSFKLKFNFIDAAIKLFKTLLQSPIQVIFNLEIGFFFISSIVNISDKICVGWDDGLKPFIIGIDKWFLNSFNFLSLSVLNIKAFPKEDKIFAVSPILSPPLERWSSSDLKVKALPPSCFIAI